jgi:integrase
MENITYDVRIWKTEIRRGTKVTTYTVRWKTGHRTWRQPFRIKAQADSFIAELRTATRKGEAFSLTTGRPVTWGRAGKDLPWYDFCASYVDMKWKNSAAHRRSNIAWTLVTVMPAMLASDKGKPDDKEMRAALRQWGFNSARRDDAPESAARILAWLSRNTKPVSSLNDPAATRSLLDTAATLLDGRTASAWTARGNRAVLDNAMEYAVELGMLSRNPVRSAKWKAPRTSNLVDRRSVINHAQARQLLDAVRRQAPSGPRLVAFFGVMYYAALRPEEAVNLRDYNIILPRYSGTKRRSSGRHRPMTGASYE